MSLEDNLREILLPKGRFGFGPSQESIIKAIDLVKNSPERNHKRFWFKCWNF